MSYVANLRTFVRVYELGSMSAAARDQRVSPAVASARISQLEAHLGVRLFQRTTRKLSPTEQGRAFYEGATGVIAAIEDAEASVTALTREPRGSLFVAAPLGLGRRLVAPAAREFAEAHPEIALRLRLSDRQVDLAEEGLDVAFILGRPEDSSLRIRKIAECARVLCAAPSYVERRGRPEGGEDLEGGRHECLMLRFPGATEFRWELGGPGGPRRYRVSGRLESDSGDVLTDWALAGAGIAMKPAFEVAHHLAAGRLVPVAERTPPLPVQAACLYAHRRHQDPKVRLLMEFVVERLGPAIAAAEAAPREPRSAE